MPMVVQALIGALVVFVVLGVLNEFGTPTSVRTVGAAQFPAVGGEYERFWQAYREGRPLRFVVAVLGSALTGYLYAYVPNEIVVGAAMIAAITAHGVLVGLGIWRARRIASGRSE